MDTKELLEGTVEEAKQAIEDKDNPNYAEILQTEKKRKNRKTLLKWLEERVKIQEVLDDESYLEDNGMEEEDDVEYDATDLDERLNSLEEKVEDSQISSEEVENLKDSISESRNNLKKFFEEKEEIQNEIEKLKKKSVKEDDLKEVKKRVKQVSENNNLEPDEIKEIVAEGLGIDLEDLKDIKESYVKEEELKSVREEIENEIEEFEHELDTKALKSEDKERIDSIEQDLEKLKEDVPNLKYQSKDEEDNIEDKNDEESDKNRVKSSEKEFENSSKEDEIEHKDSEASEKFEERIEKHGQNFSALRDMIQEVIVGQEEVVERVLVGLMCDGNMLLEGVPGLGKSLLVETLGRVISDSDFNRIQFVPDMLPSDILGQRVYNQEKGEFYINKGPVFTNFLLADEINRAPPKTQAAMMEVMQEKKVSIEKEEFNLEPPYLVLATQNPLEQKGTYPLPEAVIDRFFMKLVLDYPDEENEMKILRNNSISDRNLFDPLEEVLTRQEIIQAQKDVRDIHVSDEIFQYIVEIVSTARGEKENNIKRMKYVDYGPSPRASIWLSLGASGYAILDGRTYVLPKDVKKVAKPILRHRILLNYEGKISKFDAVDVVEEILDKVGAH